MHADGTFTFYSRGAEWGRQTDEWRIYFWHETYWLLRNQLDTSRREHWEAKLRTALEAIARHVQPQVGNENFGAEGEVPNHFCWHALALYRGGQLTQNPQWQAWGADILERVAQVQWEDGFWCEGGGPTTLYNYLTTMAVSLYAQFSGSEAAQAAVKRALNFHLPFTYPNGAPVETIDGRVRYRERAVPFLAPTWTRWPRGRGYLRFLLERLLAQPFGDGFSGYGFFGEVFRYLTEGEEEAVQFPTWHRLQNALAAIRRERGWTICFCGICLPPSDNRWHLDRQTHLSIWHDAVGLITGGGNSKGQKRFSTFEVRPPEGEPTYLATHCELKHKKQSDQLRLWYNDLRFEVTVSILSERALTIEAQVMRPDPQRILVMRLPLRFQAGETFATGAGKTWTLTEEELHLLSPQLRTELRYRNWRLKLPPQATFRWPLYPYNPYHPEGQSSLEDAYAVIAHRLGTRRKKITWQLEVL